MLSIFSLVHSLLFLSESVKCFIKCLDYVSKLPEDSSDIEESKSKLSCEVFFNNNGSSIPAFTAIPHF